MSDNTPLDVRMKKYEHAYRQYLPRRTYTLLRIDGRSFHQYLKDAERPFDFPFMAAMDLVAIKLCEEIMGARFAYVQSDEISLLLTDFDTHQTEPWFGGNLNKLLSIPPSLASGYLSRLRHEQAAIPQFDCRVWTKSDPVEVANYFVWRQQDWTRNSLQMLSSLSAPNGDASSSSTTKKAGMPWGHPPSRRRPGPSWRS